MFKTLAFTPAASRPKHYWRNLALFTVTTVITAFVFLQYVFVPLTWTYVFTHPKRFPVCCVTPADYGLTYESVSFITADGLTIRGWYVPSQNKAVIIYLHSFGSTRAQMVGLSAALAQHGYGALLIDLRAHGESDGEVLPYGGPEAEDVVAAVKFLQSRADVDPERIGVLGWSLGAQTAILGAARTDAIKAVVSDAPGATTQEDWVYPSLSDKFFIPMDFLFYHTLPFVTGVWQPLSIQKAVAQIAPRPLLIIGGGHEEAGLRHIFSAALEPKTLWIIPEVGHIGGFSARPDEYEQKVTEFFDTALLAEQ
jgi:dienelactone hydrolase